VCCQFDLLHALLTQHLSFSSLTQNGGNYVWKHFWLNTVDRKIVDKGCMQLLLKMQLPKIPLPQQQIWGIMIMEPKILFALKLDAAVRTIERTFYHTFVSFRAFLSWFFGRPLCRGWVIRVLGCVVWQLLFIGCLTRNPTGWLFTFICCSLLFLCFTASLCFCQTYNKLHFISQSFKLVLFWKRVVTNDYGLIWQLFF